MRALQNYFLVHYQQTVSLFYRRKAQVFVQASFYGCVTLSVALLIDVTGQNDPYELAAHANFLVLTVAALFLVRVGRLEWAINAIVLIFVSTIFISHIMSDLRQLPGTLSYLRMLETTIVFVIGTVIMSLCTIRPYPIWLMTTSGMVMTIWHYTLLVDRHYGGEYSPRMLTTLLIYLLLMGFTGAVSALSFAGNNALFRAFALESLKVRRLNQTLERKVTERTQQLATQNDELKKVNAELDQFVYRVSHDLRAPLVSVMGLITLAEEETDLTQIREYLGMKRRSMERLDAFIRDIMHLSRNARTSVVPEDISFEALTSEVFQEQGYGTQAQHLALLTDVTQDSPFFSDRSRLRIILHNLVSNAIRYSNPYREQPFVRVSVRVEGPLATLEVHDNGQGIGAEHLDKIFDMFYRASSQKTGSGLGLYIVKESVQKLGGTLQVASTLGEGTCFTIILTSQVPPTSVHVVVQEAVVA